jgi:hypothetical protein
VAQKSLQVGSLHIYEKAMWEQLINKGTL